MNLSSARRSLSAIR